MIRGENTQERIVVTQDEVQDVEIMYMNKRRLGMIGIKPLFSSFGCRVSLMDHVEQI